MADVETNSNVKVTTAFRVPKRELNIGGIDKKNRPYNSRFTRPIKKNEMFEELVGTGFISNVTLGSKNCFFVKEMSEDNKQDLLTKLDVDAKVSQKKYSEADINDNGWWTIETEVKDGIKPCKELEESISAYHSYSDPEKKNCLTMYGEVGFSVDFSKLGMISDDEGGIIYPYGILFFSDTKAFVNQFSARCAVLPSRLEKARNNVYIKQIDCENWTNAQIKGSFRSSGHFIIFYVTKEETVDDNLYPLVHLIDIEATLNRERDGTVSAVGIGKVEQSETLAKDAEGDSFVSEVEFLIKHVFAKYSTVSIAASRFASDYIYLIGDKPQFYDLSCFNSDSNDKKEEGTFGNVDTVQTEPKANDSKKKNKNKSKNKNESADKEKDTPAVTDKKDSTPVNKVEDQLITEVSESAIVDETDK